MFNRIKLSMLLGKLNVQMPITESIYASEKPSDNLTGLLGCSTGTLSLMIQFLEEAAIFAAKSRSRIVHFPEGKDMVIRMSRILVVIEHEVETKRDMYPDGPALDRVQPKWEALVQRFDELLQQVEFID